MLGRKAQLIKAKIPNGRLVYQTYLSAYAYAHRLPMVAPSRTAGEKPGAEVMFVGAVRKVVTNSVASARGRPAATAYSPTRSGSAAVNLFTKML